MLVRRDTGEKIKIALADLVPSVERVLTEIQQNLFAKALEYQRLRLEQLILGMIL